MILSPLTLILAISAPKLERLLFIGNSFTYVNNVPNMVKNLLESDGSGRKVFVQMVQTGHLNDIAKDPSIFQTIKSGKWDAVFLESAMVSMSHSINYPQDGGIALGKAALAAKARAIYWCEWPRRGIRETDYTYNVYESIRKATKGELIPVCYVWDFVNAKRPTPQLWAPDGNHASVNGSYLASLAMFYYLTDGQKREPKWVDPRVKTGDAAQYMGFAKRVIQERLHPNVAKKK